MVFELKYNLFFQVVKEVIEVGVCEVGIDVCVGEIGGVIQEIMESFEVEIDGQIYFVKSICNFIGYNIFLYSIYGMKVVLIVKSNDQIKMEEGDVFVIEIFGFIGNGYVWDDMECFYYVKVGDVRYVDLRLLLVKLLLNVINKNFGMLLFCRWFLDRFGQEKYLLGVSY